KRGILSAVGILDGCEILIPPDTPSDLPSSSNRIPVAQNILLVFKTGSSPGKHLLKLIVQQPDGQRSEAGKHEIDLSPQPHGGANVRINAALGVFNDGVYWVDVLLDDQLITRMPLNILIKRATMPTAPGASPESALPVS